MMMMIRGNATPSPSEQRASSTCGLVIEVANHQYHVISRLARSSPVRALVGEENSPLPLSAPASATAHAAIFAAVPGAPPGAAPGPAAAGGGGEGGKLECASSESGQLRAAADAA